MWRLLLDVVIACVLGLIAAGPIAALVVPRLSRDVDYTAALAGFILLCVGGVFVALRRWRRRLARQASTNLN